jgi:predicted transport protein
MDLYRLTKSELEPVSKSAFDLEKDIQSLVEQNLTALFSLEFVASEFAIDEFRIDTLAFDEENNAFVIIEYKKGSSYSVVDQGYAYLSKMLEKKADFVLEYQERTQKSLKKSDVDWTQSKVVFISPAFNSYQKNSVNFRDVPFELWEIKKYGKDLISLVQHKSTSKESIENFKATTHEMASVSSEIQVADEQDHLKKTTPECVELWEALKDYFSAFADTAYATKKHYISIKRDSTAVCFVHFQKNSLQINLRKGNIHADGSKKSQGFFELDDPKKMCEERTIKWKSGVTGIEYLITLNNKHDLEYVIWLLKQKYDAIGG